MRLSYFQPVCLLAQKNVSAEQVFTIQRPLQADAPKSNFLAGTENRIRETENSIPVKTNAKLTALLALWLATAVSALAQTTAFTYQGRLNTGGTPANGVYDLQFTVHDAEASGSQIGPTWTTNGVSVSNGLFTTTLNFGAGVFNGNARWLSVAVRTNGGAGFTVLSPRQPLTPAPYALYAPNAGAAATATTAAAAQGVTASAVTAAGIASGQVVKSLNGLRDAVALAAGPNVSFATNANTLTISAAGGGASGGWTTTGNAGTTPTANFLGTTDGQPLVLKAARVGVNTNNPQAALHVNGTVLATQFAGDGSGLSNVPAALATPFTLTTLATTNFYGHARGLAISGYYAYVAQGYAGLHVYDISDPAHPSHVGPDPSLVWNASAVALSGHYVFVAGDTLSCVDISSPANPVIVGSAPGTRACYGVAVSGNVAYVAADADGLFTYDIANPTTPVSLGHIDNGGHALGVAVAGNFAYLANDLDGLRIYHIANPAAPVNIASRNEGGQAYGIAVAGDFAYLANYNDGLRIYNISNPTNPVSVGHVFDDGYACGVAVSGRYAYVANNNLGLRVYDLSDPAHPTSVGVAPISGDGVALAVAVAGPYAYTANESGGLATYFAAPLATVPGVIGATAFMGDGSSLTNLNAGQLTGQLAPSVASGLWQVTGNTGTTPGRSFLGTSDNQALEFKVNGLRALRLEPSVISPNVIGGYSGNVVSNGSSGATIGGGGSLASPNRVGALFATVVGGVGNTASGGSATAMGDSTTASGSSSTAMGLGTSAGGDFSTAMGIATRASAYVSTALGFETTASGYYSTAMGAETTASGWGSTAMGVETTARGMNSFAAGSNTVASGEASFAMGLNAQATNTAAVAIGQNTIAGGRNSTALGYWAHATGPSSTAMGYHTEASGTNSTAMGDGTTASGEGSTAMGLWNTASGTYSTALGALTEASGIGSTAMGIGASAIHDGGFVWSDWSSLDVFASTGNNQFLIRAQGGVGINKNNPANALDVNGTVAAGNFALSGPPYGDLKLRDDDFHGLGWYGAGKLFAGVNVNGPTLYGNAGGVLGTRGPADKIALAWDATAVTIPGDLIMEGWIWRRFGGQLFHLDSEPNYNAYWNPNNPSDQRLKRDIETIPAALDSLKQLRGVTFHWNDTGLDRLTRNIETKWKSGSGRPEDDQKLWAEKRQEEHERLARRQTGFIAQELERVFPDWVTTDEQGFKQINTKGLDAVLVNAVNEQQVQLETQQAKIAALETAVAELKALVKTLAEKVNGDEP